MKKNKNKVYKELQQQYSEEEIADSFVFSIELPASEQEAAHREFLELRMKSYEEVTEEEKLKSKLFVFKTRLQEYFASKVYSNEYSFGSQLKKYVELIGRNQSEVAGNISVHKARLSRIINDKEGPNTDLMYRLEEHSSGEIPAYYWWKLYARQLEHKIRTDIAKRQEEARKVNNPLSLRA